MITTTTSFVTAINAATGTASHRVAAIITEKLCKPVCSHQSIQPTPTVNYSIANIESVDNVTTFVTIEARGTISYVPKNACGCNTITQAFTERFTLMFYNPAATSAPTITMTQGASDGSLTNFNCLTARSYQIATNVDVVATYA